MKANGPDEKNEAARSSFKYLNIFNKFYSFEKTTLSIGYQICKSTSWNKATVGDKVMKELGTKKESLDIDSYAYAVKSKNKYFKHLITVAQIHREISRHVYFFI